MKMPKKKQHQENSASDLFGGYLAGLEAFIDDNPPEQESPKPKRQRQKRQKKPDDQPLLAFLFDEKEQENKELEETIKETSAPLPAVVEETEWRILTLDELKALTTDELKKRQAENEIRLRSFTIKEKNRPERLEIKGEYNRIFELLLERENPRFAHLKQKLESPQTTLQERDIIEKELVKTRERRAKKMSQTEEKIEEEIAKRKELAKLSNEELEKKKGEIALYIRHSAHMLDPDYRRVIFEQMRRKELVKLKEERFTPTGKDVMVFPNLFLQIISINRSARRPKPDSIVKPDEANEQKFATLLYYNEKDRYSKSGIKLKGKRHEYIRYDGFELSMEDILVFEAIIKNTINEQKKGKNPWGILKCKLSFIRDFIGVESNGKQIYERIWNNLYVLKNAQIYMDLITNNQQNARTSANLITDFYTAEWQFIEAGLPIPDDFATKAKGEFYYRISPPLIKFFQYNFSKVNTSAVIHFMRGGQNPNDLKAWLYIYFMSLFHKEMNQEYTDKETGLTMARPVLISPKFLLVDDIKRMTLFKGSRKELKSRINDALRDISQFFECNGGKLIAQWDEKNRYKLNILQFKKTRLHDIEFDPVEFYKNRVAKLGNKMAAKEFGKMMAGKPNRFAETIYEMRIAQIDLEDAKAYQEEKNAKNAKKGKK